MEKNNFHLKKKRIQLYAQSHLLVQNTKCKEKIMKKKIIFQIICSQLVKNQFFMLKIHR